jgi:hypothetical protein
LIRILSAWHIASTPKNIVASFRRSGIVVRWDEINGFLLATIVPEEGDRVQEVYLYKQQEEETGEYLISDDELDAMPGEMD